MRMFFTVLLGLFLFSGASAFAGGDSCTSEDCKVHREGVNRTVIPSNDVVCIYFVQADPERVTLRIDLKVGGSRYYDTKNDMTRDHICVGRHFVRDALFMTICNDNAHADYEVEHVAIVAGKEKHSHEAEACLFGKAACKGMGYLTRD